MMNVFLSKQANRQLTHSLESSIVQLLLCLCVPACVLVCVHTCGFLLNSDSMKNSLNSLASSRRTCIFPAVS